MTAKNILLQHVDNAEADLYYAREKLADAKQKLAEYQEPTMSVDTLCQVWKDQSHMNICLRYYSHTEDGDYYFFQHGVTSKTNDKVPAVRWPNFKIIEEPGLPWKEIDDNVPEAEVYLVKDHLGSHHLTDRVICNTGQYIILKE